MKEKKFLLKVGLGVVLGLITFIYGLLYFVNPLLLKTSFAWLFFVVLFENVLYKVWQICMIIYSLYVLYYLVSRMKSKI